MPPTDDIPQYRRLQINPPPPPCAWRGSTDQLGTWQQQELHRRMVREYGSPTPTTRDNQQSRPYNERESYGHTAGGLAERQRREREHYGGIGVESAPTSMLINRPPLIAPTFGRTPARPSLQEH